MTTFEDFIRGGLLSHGVVSGVLLVSRHGEVVYNYGELQRISQTEIKQFMGLFVAGAKLTDTGYQKDFSLTLNTGARVLYKTYQTSYSSVYATCTSNSGGLAVCNLPHGVLVCVYPGKQPASKAHTCIDNFCDLLRR